MNAWAEANIEAPKRENSGSKELQREFTTDQVKYCVAKPKNRKTTEADGIGNEFLKDEGKRMVTILILPYNWILKNEYTAKRWREGVVVNLYKKGDKAD